MTILIAIAALASPMQKEDRTEIALERCLASPAAAPVVPMDPEEGEQQSDEPPMEQAAPQGQSDGRATCFDNARRSYDRRVIATYRSLLKKASPDAAEWLSQTSQAWLNYRQTMTGDVDATAAARDHALWIEGVASQR